MSDLSSILQDLEKSSAPSNFVKETTFVPSFITDDANARRRRKNGMNEASRSNMNIVEKDDGSSLKRQLSWLFGDSSEKKAEEEPGKESFSHNSTIQSISAES
jgi:hypothetical protein